MIHSNESQSLFSITMKIFSQSQFLFPFVFEKQQEISSKREEKKCFLSKEAEVAFLINLKETNLSN